MPAQLIDGKACAEQHLRQLQQEISAQRDIPKLVVVIVGDDPASHIYVTKKHQAAKKIGIESEIRHLSSATTQTELINLITELNNDNKVNGILIQLPLPAQINSAQVIETIHPQKDVDGFHPYNLGRLAAREPLLRPCTPYGVIQLLEYEKIELKGINALVVGASNHVGRPMALELLLKGATVTVCHRFTQDLSAHVMQADLVITCAGKPFLIKGKWIKENAIVVDVGINRLQDKSLVGDVEFQEASLRASKITPVPGGVGPMTVAMLMKNTFIAYQLQNFQ